MKLLVATDTHLYKTPDGHYWCPTMFGKKFYGRYLGKFEKVRIAARCKEVDQVNEKWLQVDAPGIEFFELPFYQGPIQLAKKYFRIKKCLKNVADSCDVAIFRMPSPTANLVYKEVKKHTSIPIGAEIIYDPTDELNNKDVHLLKKLVAYSFSLQLKDICHNANGVSYVTEFAIQKNFPSRARVLGESNCFFESFYSSIDLPDSAFGTPRDYKNKKSFVIAHSNMSMNDNRKGELVLIQALKILIQGGYDVSLVFMGDGSKRNQFEKAANDLGIDNNVNFIGLLSDPREVTQVLQSADFYVLPTLAEGLPRGIIEAMAQGLVCISSPVGGISELLDTNNLIDPLNSALYAKRIEELINNSDEMNKLSEENIRKARKYESRLLQKRRDEFYQKLIEIADA